jgi:hypothetical protein
MAVRYRQVEVASAKTLGVICRACFSRARGDLAVRDAGARAWRSSGESVVASVFAWGASSLDRVVLA